MKAKYCDGSETPMALMSIIIGEQASGKGVCRRIESIWAKKMDKDDEKPREEEAWYQQHKGKKGVVDPKPCIRHIGDTISKSALMRRQLCADGHTMYMFSEELGSMKSVWKVFGDYFRKAFDQSEVGQDYITATSGVTHAQLNFTGCCTQNIFQKFFTDDNIEDGSSSRMMLAKMPDTSFAPLSQHHGYTEEEQDNILKAVNLLERSHGVMELPRMCEEFCQWLEAKSNSPCECRSCDGCVSSPFRSHRLPLWRYLPHSGADRRGDRCLHPFCQAVADYVLAMQMEMFGLRLDKQQQDNEAIPVYKSRNTLLFAQLPEQFTLFDASRERGDGASRETIRKMISRWTKRGLCKKLKSGDTEIWQKLTLLGIKHIYTFCIRHLESPKTVNPPSRFGCVVGDYCF